MTWNQGALDEARRYGFKPFSRRGLIKLGAAGILAAQMKEVESLAWVPQRAALAANIPPSQIQIEIGKYIPPAQFPQKTVIQNGVNFSFGPVFTMFAPVKLSRPPTAQDQKILEEALLTIEQRMPMHPFGVFTYVAYGIPYFQKLEKAGMSRTQIRAMIPKLLDSTGRATNRLALEEAVPGPTDVSKSNPDIKKEKFNQPVVIEQNDMLFTFRSDIQENLLDVLMWLNGSNKLKGASVPSPAFNGLLQFQAPRLQFQQPGLTRKVADKNKLPYADRINPQSPMWMGFADQHVSAAGPAPIITFQGNEKSKLTNCQPTDYFANGSIQHLAHDILDLDQFYRLPNPNSNDPFLKKGEPYSDRIQYMFRSNSKTPLPMGNPDQFKDGGGPAFVDNVFQGATDAEANANGIGTIGGEHRLGHNACLQRSSRTADGTAVHVRNDGAGFTSMDLPAGSKPEPSLEFTIFVPTSEFFRQLRINAASLDLQKSGNVDPHHNGLERYITCTRRQNFLVPPRARRAFPLAEAMGTSVNPTPTTPGTTAPQMTPPQVTPGQIGAPGQGASPIQTISNPAQPTNPVGATTPSPIPDMPINPVQGIGGGDDGTNGATDIVSQVLRLIQNLVDLAGGNN